MERRNISFLITGLLFDILAGAFVGALAWIIFRRRLSPVGASVVIACTCAILIAVAWDVCDALGGMGFAGWVCNFLLVPFSIAWFSGVIPSIPVALLLQILLMAVVGGLVWRGMRGQEIKTNANHTSDGIRQPADGSPKP
jgi:hypothetical protein